MYIILVYKGFQILYLVQDLQNNWDKFSDFMIWEDFTIKDSKAFKLHKFKSTRAMNTQITHIRDIFLLSSLLSMLLVV